MGIPVAMISAIYNLALTTGANRVIRGARIEHVCGDPDLGPDKDFAYGLQIVRTALQALQTAVSGPTLFEPDENRLRQGRPSMRLEIGTFPVHNVVFGAQTQWRDGLLELARDEILDAVRSDPRIAKADLELAKPGESVRIWPVRDVVEPRVKVEGPGVVYPGICGRSTRSTKKRYSIHIKLKTTNVCCCII